MCMRFRISEVPNIRKQGEIATPPGEAQRGARLPSAIPPIDGQLRAGRPIPAEAGSHVGRRSLLEDVPLTNARQEARPCQPQGPRPVSLLVEDYALDQIARIRREVEPETVASAPAEQSELVEVLAALGRNCLLTFLGVPGLSVLDVPTSLLTAVLYAATLPAPKPPEPGLTIPAAAGI